MRLLATRLTAIASAVKRLFSPASLFRNAEQGVWYDPSDFTTLFQDSAGTTPVTAVEQPVGKILDKSGRGNHATQATSASRPLLSARVNLCVYSEFPSGVADAQLYLGFATSTLSGYSGALVCTNLPGPAYAYKTTGLPTNAGTYYIRAVVKMADGLAPSLPSSDPASALNDFSFVIGGLSAAATLGTEISPGVFVIYGSILTSGGNNGRYGIQRLSGGARRSFTVTAYSVVPANQAGLPYQRVNTATDYDTAGFPTYLKFDGIDDSLATASIDFTSTDKMTVFAGVRKLSDAANGKIVELGLNADTTNSTFQLEAPSNMAFNRYFGFSSRGTATQYAFYTTADGASPTTVVATGLSSISGDSVALRRNGVQVASSTADQGTGNYANAPLYIGRRGGTTLPLNGHLYSLIVRGAQSSASQITSAESYVNSKTGAY